ncbi:hypothetical protein IWQ60_005713 [Tieghemiomyces parasiticus]|uniref:Ribosomal protein bL31m N-terminal domain-containing protein n=1 Tax=Tieghemiomyces parasiticus TaxID=78921 RepID=A0A9W8DMU6_9FUNG|nr:hypothetical protein IWQ60_010378 [Tieghemiomyces parasiticus]KAJ1923687.1 hypothetical protein IWQ60_005713 [Tieghemiomyces parasiticus]
MYTLHRSLAQLSVRGARTYASVTKKRYTGPTTHPQVFNQRVTLTDGSTITLRTTSPRPQIKLTKDTRNHPLWNPEFASAATDDTTHIEKFSDKFGSFDGMDDLFHTESANVEEDLESMQRSAQQEELKRVNKHIK